MLELGGPSGSSEHLFAVLALAPAWFVNKSNLLTSLLKRCILLEGSLDFGGNRMEEGLRHHELLELPHPAAEFGGRGGATAASM